jgi:hypothetical protein
MKTNQRWIEWYISCKIFFDCLLWAMQEESLMAQTLECYLRCWDWDGTWLMEAKTKSVGILCFFFFIVEYDSYASEKRLRQSRSRAKYCCYLYRYNYYKYRLWHPNSWKRTHNLGSFIIKHHVFNICVYLLFLFCY